jgi:RNA polymerase sigma factor (sigma-70 family)
MGEHDRIVTRFEEHRAHLQAVAYRMLGSRSEADDAVQEAWLRLSRSDTDGVENLGGWLTTVVARVCLDMLRSRKARREDPVDADLRESRLSSTEAAPDPEQDVLIADSVGPALLVVLDTLGPAERLAFVLHDVFGVSFEEIAIIVGRSPTAARQLASRARQRVQGAATPAGPNLTRKQEIVGAFLAASRDGDFEALLAVLDPEVVFRADDIAVQAAVANQARGAPSLSREVHGARVVAEAFKGRARGARPALIDGVPGAVWLQGDQTRAAFAFTIDDGKIVAIDLLMDPARLGQLDVVVDDFPTLHFGYESR